MIVAAKPYDIERFCERVSYRSTQDAKGVALKHERKVCAMCLYDYWTPNSVQIHIWSAGPKYLFDPTFLHAVFEYPFVQGGRNLLIAITPADAVASLKVSDILGFREVFRLPDAWEVGIPMVVKEMRKENCRWLRN